MLSKEAVTVALVFLVALTGCGGSGPSAEDLERLRSLEQLFGDRYEFTLKEEFYLSADRVDGQELANEECEKIFRTFRFEQPNGTALRQSSYVYVNFYEMGQFRFQLFFDPRLETIERSDTPHY